MQQTVETATPAPQTPVQQPTLAEYASGLQQVHTDLQRQTDAYGFFRAALAALNQIAADPDAERPRLPFVKVMFPSDGKPIDASLDLNQMTPADLAQMRPIFAMLADRSGRELLDAWSKVHKVADETRPIVEATRTAQGR